MNNIIIIFLTLNLTLTLTVNHKSTLLDVILASLWALSKNYQIASENIFSLKIVGNKIIKRNFKRNYFHISMS